MIEGNASATMRTMAVEESSTGGEATAPRTVEYTNGMIGRTHDQPVGTAMLAALMGQTTTMISATAAMTDKRITQDIASILEMGDLTSGMIDTTGVVRAILVGTDSIGNSEVAQMPSQFDQILEAT